MSMFSEVFGFDALARSLVEAEPRVAPDLPWEEDFRWQLSPVSSSASAALSKIEQTAFSDAVAGEIASPENVLQGFDGLTEFRKAVPLPKPMLIPPATSAALANFLGKAERIQKCAPSRKRAIAGMLETFRASLCGRGSAEAWERLQKSFERHLTTTLMEAV